MKINRTVHWMVGLVWLGVAGAASGAGFSDQLCLDSVRIHEGSRIDWVWPTVAVGNLAGKPVDSVRNRSLGKLSGAATVRPGWGSFATVSFDGVSVGLKRRW